MTTYAEATGLGASLLPICEGSFQPLSGKGLSCRIDTSTITSVTPAAAVGMSVKDASGSSTGSSDTAVAVGSPSYIRAHIAAGGGVAGGFTKAVADLVAGLEGSGKTAVCAAIDGQMAVVIGISDAIRPEAAEVCTSARCYEILV